MSSVGEDIVFAESEDFSFDPTSADTLELDVRDLRDEEDIVYPAMLLSGVLFTDCLRVLQTQKRSSYREVDTWVENPDNDGYTRIGTVQLDSDMLLVLRHLRINVTLYYDKDTLETLDLQDPETLIKFI